MTSLPPELVQIQQLVTRLGAAGLLRFVASDWGSEYSRSRGSRRRGER